MSWRIHSIVERGHVWFLVSAPKEVPRYCATLRFARTVLDILEKP